MFIENQRFSDRFFRPSLVRHPDPLCFEAHKPANRCRIFVFGESAAMGDPDPAFAFSRVLEVLLRERYPGIDFEVINTSITAINSNVILPIARDSADKEGDLWVVYMGNNEVVGPFGAGTVFGSQAPPLGLVRLNLALKSTRIGQVANGVSQRFGGSSKAPKSWAGMEMFLNQQVRQDDPRMKRVYGNFEQNLRDILLLGARSGAQVLVGTMASNVRDFAPLPPCTAPL